MCHGVLFRNPEIPKFKFKNKSWGCSQHSTRTQGDIPRVIPVLQYLAISSLITRSSHRMFVPLFVGPSYIEHAFALHQEEQEGDHFETVGANDVHRMYRSIMTRQR